MSCFIGKIENTEMISKRYEIAMDFKKKFIEQNKNVYEKTIKDTFVSINGDDVRVSRIPYSIEEAEHALVFFEYKYLVQSNDDSSQVALFFNSNGEVEDYIEIDGWRLSFSEPKTSFYRSRPLECFMKKDSLGLSVGIKGLNIRDAFPRIWHLFSIIRTCKTQKEIDYAYQVYQKEGDLLSLKQKNLMDESKIAELEFLLDTYKELLDKIKGMLNGQSE